MAQHDYNIANQTFPNTRTDINNVLLAISSNNSGDSAPSTTYANQWWYETDTNKLYIRNEDNDAWIHVLTLNQTNDTVSSVEGGTTLAGIDDQSSSNDDQITITDSAVIINEDSDSVDFRVESNGSENCLFVDASENRVGVGTNTPLNTMHIKSTGDPSNDIRLILQTNATDGNCAIDFYNSAGTEKGRFLYDTDDNTLATKVNGSEVMRITSGGNIGIGESANIDARLHVTTADSGGTFHSQADEIGCEGSGHTGINILSGSSSEGSIYFGDSEDNNAGRIVYDNSTNSMILFSNATEALRMSTSQVLSTGGEAGPDTTNGGITIDTNAEDGTVLTLKNSDVAHGMTNEAQTDTYFRVGKADNAKGGVFMSALTEDMDSERFVITTNGDGNLSTAKSTSGKGALTITANNKNGTGVTFANDNGNIFSVANYIQTKFIVDADGDIHYDGSDAGAFDSYDDAMLVRSWDLSHNKNVINSTFDKYVKYNHESLANAKLVGREEDGTPNHFVNVTGMQRLHNGAIWQQYEKTQRLTQAMYKLATKTLGKEEADKLLDEEEIKLLN